MNDLLTIGASIFAMILAINLFDGLRARLAKAVQDMPNGDGQGLDLIHTKMDIAGAKRDHG